MTTALNAVGFIDDRFIIGGASGVVKSSANGVDWVDVSSPIASTSSVIHMKSGPDGALFALVHPSSGSDYMMWTADGRTWLRSALILATGTHIAVERGVVMLNASSNWSYANFDCNAATEFRVPSIFGDVATNFMRAA